METKAILKHPNIQPTLFRFQPAAENFISEDIFSLFADSLSLSLFSLSLSSLSLSLSLSLSFSLSSRRRFVWSPFPDSGSGPHSILFHQRFAQTQLYVHQRNFRSQTRSRKNNAVGEKRKRKPSHSGFNKNSRQEVQLHK